MDYLPPVAVFPVNLPLAHKALKQAQLDDHYLLAPTHVVMRDDEVVGAFNTGPMVNWWMDSKKCGREDSRFVLMALETLQHQNGLNTYIMLCADTSPYKKRMENFGFQEVGATNIFVRKLDGIPV
jgi:hypothetical protein